jgi:hypothetical protein
MQKAQKMKSDKKKTNEYNGSRSDKSNKPKRGNNRWEKTED